MPRFSERIGIQPIRSALQTDSMDDALRYGLWNVLCETHWRLEEQAWLKPGQYTPLAIAIWRDHLKQPVDRLPQKWQTFVEAVRLHFMGGKWWEVYDLIEFVGTFEGDANYPRYSMLVKPFRNSCNQVLTRELSGFRFVAGELSPLTSEEQIASVEKAVDQTRLASPLAPISMHLSQALALLSDRQSPDYRNSIKESISAVEALCKLIVGDEQTTLGAALNRIETERKITLHKRYKDAFVALYAYTSDADGIRHALKDTPNADLQDALFMLVTCSAFVNYLLARVADTGIQLGKQG